ncbi:MAG: hypothetical protein R3C03_09880 [Pirellulaceae bacterium]
MPTAGSKEFVTQCPGCANMVLLPRVIAVDAKVRCTKCSRVFSLASILPDDLPRMELVDSDEAAELPMSSDVENVDIDVDPTRPLPVSSILRNGAKRKRRSSRSGDETVKAKRASNERDSVRETRAKTRSETRRSHSHREESSSSFGEIAKVVFGALLALPVAQLIIWWGLGLDPLGIGPSVGQIAGPIVPAAIRTVDAEVESNE